MLKLRGRDSLRGKLALESLANRVARRLAVEHREDRELFVLKAIVLESERVFYRPVFPRLPPLPPHHKIAPHLQRDRASGAGSKCGRHGKMKPLRTGLFLISLRSLC